ncbi:MAG TPA: peptidase M20, partial [Ktedonobacter sp.]|nr:peptidase M20 [Ktedonobacter sp.]
MTDAVTTYLDEHEGEAQALLERLCRQPSVAAQGLGMPEMADMVESLLSDTGFQT